MSQSRNTLLALIFVLFFISKLLAQNGSISLELKAHKTALILGEPLFLTATTENISANPVMIYAQRAPSYFSVREVLKIMISRDGKQFETWSDGFRAAGKSSPRKLERGEKITSELVVLSDSKGRLAFPTNGTYFVGVGCVTVAGEETVSSLVRIEISEPIDKDLEAWNLLKNIQDYGNLGQIPTKVSLPEQTIAEFMEILQSDDSAYAPYLALFLGRYYSEQEQNNFAKAKELFSVAERSENDFIRSHAQVHLHRIQKKRNRS